MPLKTTMLSFALASAMALPAFAQTTPNTSPVCNNTNAAMAHAPAGAQNGAATMAGTSSDGARTASGASSAAIGTGPTDKTGVNSPCVPGATGTNGSSGALPNSTPNTP